MLSLVLHYALDLWAFSAVVLAVTLAVHRYLSRAGHGGLPRLGWAAIATVLGLALLLTTLADLHARKLFRDRLSGLAPTYARELERLGHANLTLATPPDDPTYLTLIAAEKRWLSVNPCVNDIYTFRRTEEGKYVFLVDSETDYDHDGTIDVDREQRTSIGEEYPEATDNFKGAIEGLSSFDDEPVSDRWGSWVSAYVPLRDANGRVEGGLGVDYDAKAFLSEIALNRIGALGMVSLLWVVVTASAAIIVVVRSESRQRAALQRELIDASRQAGMAEIATGVLHNVGNVLNSVNVSTTVLSEKIRGSKLAGFTRAADMIRAHEADFAGFVHDDAKGKLLPGYLVKLAGLLVDEQEEVLREVSGLSRNVEHIKQIVASQQKMAKTLHVCESFELRDLLDDAVKISQPDISHAGVELIWNRTVSPKLVGDRHAILQILVNLMSNAAKAMADCPVRKLTIKADVVSGDGPDAARIAVIDTGVGIEPEDLKKIFAHGFTTRADGHGFGLHHSANTARLLKGSLTVASDGRGKGATFVLTIPLVASTKDAACAA